MEQAEPALQLSRKHSARAIGRSTCRENETSVNRTRRVSLIFSGLETPMPDITPNQKLAIVGNGFSGHTLSAAYRRAICARAQTQARPANLGYWSAHPTPSTNSCNGSSMGGNMKPRHVISRVIRKASKPIFRAIGRDSITFTKVMPRDDLKEIGTAYGGWIIPESLLDSNSICYCVGCGEDISFDLGLINQIGCHVFGFDPTPRAIKYVREHIRQYEKYHFSEVGIWDKEDILKFYAPQNPEHVSHSLLNLQQTQVYFEAKVKRLSDIMRENSHKKLDLLKLDVEGAEYKVINSIIEDKLDIKILCVEYDECFHPLDNNYSKRIRETISTIIQTGYSLVCAQGNGNYTFVKNADARTN